MSKNNITKQNILQAAKEEFYENGYINTTIDSITKKVNGRPSWVSYHFRYKDNIVSEIYNDFFANAKSVIINNNPKVKDPMVIHFALSILNLRIIMSSENNIRFYLEAILHENNYRLMKGYLSQTFSQIADTYNIIVSNNELISMIKIECAGRRQIFLEKFVTNLNNTDNQPLNDYDFINLSTTLMPRIMGIDIKNIESNLLLAWKMNHIIELEYLDFKLLI